MEGARGRKGGCEGGRKGVDEDKILEPVWPNNRNDQNRNLQRPLWHAHICCKAKTMDHVVK